MKTAIVTGATGYIGFNLVSELLGSDINVIAVLKNSDGIAKLPTDERLSVLCCDMSEYDRLPDMAGQLLMDRSDVVFYHLAWDGVSGDNRSNIELQLKNALACRLATESAARMGCSKFIGIGSIMEREAIAATRTNGVSPSQQYIYGEAKHLAHYLSKSIANYLEIDHIWATLTNPYGENDDSSRFINATLRKIAERRPLEFTAGLQMYDFIYISDLVRALRLIGESGQANTDYLIGSGNPRRLRDYVVSLVNETGTDLKPVFGAIPYMGAEMNEEDFSITQLIADTGFMAEYSFEEGIRKTYGRIRKKYE